MTETRARKLWLWLFVIQVIFILFFWTKLNGGPITVGLPFDLSASDKATNEPELALWLVLIVSTLQVLACFLALSHAKSIGQDFVSRFPVRYPDDLTAPRLVTALTVCLLLLSHVAPVYFIAYGWQKITSEGVICHRDSGPTFGTIWSTEFLFDGHRPFNHDVRLASDSTCANYTTFEPMLVPALLALISLSAIGLSAASAYQVLFGRAASDPL